MNGHYRQGFLDKCAELNVDPQRLVKLAELGDFDPFGFKPDNRFGSYVDPKSQYFLNPFAALNGVFNSVKYPKDSRSGGTSSSGKTMFKHPMRIDFRDEAGKQQFMDRLKTPGNRGGLRPEEPPAGWFGDLQKKYPWKPGEPVRGLR